MKRHGRKSATALIDKHGVIQFVLKGVSKNQNFLYKLKQFHKLAKAKWYGFTHIE